MDADGRVLTKGELREVQKARMRLNHAQEQLAKYGAYTSQVR